MMTINEETLRRHNLGSTIACFILLSSHVGAAEGGSWSPGESMGQGRASHAATLLKDGRVLVAGGSTGPLLETSAVEIYDPEAGVWSFTGSLVTRRAAHTATLLNDGRVLVVAGSRYRPDTCSILSSAEVYDINTGTWSETGSLGRARTSHRAVLLDDGRVLVVGGNLGFCSGTLDYTDLYDPETGAWSVANPMTVGRSAFTATKLLDGRVLVAGGRTGTFPYHPTSAAEIYDPDSGIWIAIADMNKAHDRHIAQLLTDGRVLVAGLIGTELYDPTKGTWTVTGELNVPRSSAESELLSNGSVLIVGGLEPGSSTVLDSAEFYDPDAGVWEVTGAMKTSRLGHRITLLNDGRVLAAGGQSRFGDVPMPTSEIYTH